MTSIRSGQAGSGPRTRRVTAGRHVFEPAGRAVGDGAVLRAALAYAAQGLLVFPLSWMRRPIRLCAVCRRGGLCPGQDQCICAVDTCHGFWAATTDPTVITGWYTQHPDWQVAIRTGQPSGLVVVDVDLDKGGLDTLMALQAAGLDIRGTDAQLSGSGQSFHLFYAHPGGWVKCSQGRTSTGLGAGVDIRADGGYIVAAPSRHPSTGARNEMLGGLVNLPAWSSPVADAGRRAVAHSASPKRVARSESSKTPGPLRDEGQGRCTAVADLLDKAAASIKQEPHHNAVRKPVMQLLRLRSFGHRGVSAALDELGDVYVAGMAARHAPRAARDEYDLMVTGAEAAMDKREAVLDGACFCDINWAKALNRERHGLTKGVAGNTEAKVMRHLLMRVEQRGRWTVTGESQRTIGLSIDVHQPTVSKALKRLRDRHLLSRAPSGHKVMPPWARENVSIERQKTAGSSIDNFSRASVHPLFGAGGLGGGVQDTFAVLPEYSVGLLHGRLFRLREGTVSGGSVEAALAAPTGLRQIPRAAPGQEGATVSQIALQTGRHPSTVRAHLRRLHQEGLTVQEGLAVQEGRRWWRVRFDPVAVQQELAVVDTAARKAVEVARQRRGWWEGRYREDLTDDGKPLWDKVYRDGHAHFVDCQTGEVRWRDPVPDQERQETDAQDPAS